MRKEMLMMIAVAGMAVAAYAMLKTVPVQAECCSGDPICWPQCPPAVATARK